MAANLIPCRNSSYILRRPAQGRGARAVRYGARSAVEAALSAWREAQVFSRIEGLPKALDAA